MFKTLPVAVFVTVMSLSPAYAAGEWTEAHMRQMDGMIAKMTDAAKKKEAMMHLDMSKAAMKKGDIEVWNGLNVPQTPLGLSAEGPLIRYQMPTWLIGFD